MKQKGSTRRDYTKAQPKVLSSYHVYPSTYYCEPNRNNYKNTKPTSDISGKTYRSMGELSRRY